MYRINTISEEVINEHFISYAGEIKSLMKTLLDGKELPFRLGTTNIEQVVLKVNPDSYTFSFLTKYSEDLNLKQLLCGDYDQLLNILREINHNIPNRGWMHKATKREYNKGLYDVWGENADGLPMLDHFNQILRWIFIDQMYEGNNHINPFDKKKHIRSYGLEVCPYCGRNNIEIEEEAGYRDDKPPIDHFLPKSIYPFFALSLYNMIPCCTECNQLSNKGENNPLSDAIPTNTFLLNPTVFYDEAIRFSYEYNEFGDMNEKNFSILVSTNNIDLEKGYFGWLKLRKYYQNRKLVVQDMYQALSKFTEEKKNFLKKEDIPENFLDNISLRTLGYQLDEMSSRRTLYKFKKDIFLFMLRKFGYEYFD